MKIEPTQLFPFAIFPSPCLDLDGALRWGSSNKPEDEGHMEEEGSSLVP